MKNKLITAALIGLTIGMTALAQTFVPLEARDLNGTDPARVNITLEGQNNNNARELPERTFGELLRSRTVELPVRIPKFAIGAIETSRLEKALETTTNGQVKGINVRFKLAEFQANYDVIRLEIKLESGVKRGTYPMTMDIVNPLTKQQGSIAFSVVVRN
jgi:hypothetical protein